MNEELFTVPSPQAPLPIPEPISAEYILVSDVNSKVLKSSEDYNEIRRFANAIRQAGGQVTVFKALKA